MNDIEFHLNMESAEVINEIIVHFSAPENSMPGWTHTYEDWSQFGLAHKSDNGSELWISLCCDGSISLMWKSEKNAKGRLINLSAAKDTADNDKKFKDIIKGSALKFSQIKDDRHV